MKSKSKPTTRAARFAAAEKALTKYAREGQRFFSSMLKSSGVSGEVANWTYREKDNLRRLGLLP